MKHLNILLFEIFRILYILRT